MVYFSLNMEHLCSNCGFHNPPGMRFCGNCGTRLADQAGLRAGDDSSVKLLPGQLGVMVGADLKERFRLAGLEAAGQRRNVTVLFADLSDYTGLCERIDSEDLYDLIQRFIRSLVEDVYRYEGTVDKIIGDGLMALFGAPIAHENNPERAVRAALDMQTGVANLSREINDHLGVDLKVHVGLHSGTVIVGSVGSNMIMDYTAIGDTVNLAHRLEEAAEPGTILVSENVYRQTKALFDYDLRPGLLLKGFSRALPAYQLLGPKGTPGSVRGLEGLQAPLIGREVELGKLKEAVHELANRKKGRFVLVTGEAGIGKSRLTAELKAQIGNIPVNILEGHSLTYRRAVSYWIFLDLLRNYLKITPETPPGQARQKLVAKSYEVMGSKAPDALPYLEHLLSLGHADTSTTERLAYLEASQLRQQIFLAVRDLLAAEARRQPLILVLEDLHWADDASLDLLAYLVDLVRQVPLFIYAISRPIQDGNLGRITARAQSQLADFFLVIPLQSLTPDQSERLLYELLSIPELPEEFRAEILQRSSGIPFYLEEILRKLIEDQVIRREERSWRLVPGTDVTALGVPDTLQGLILARFDHLDQFQRKVLQAASVIGRQFGLPLLDAVLDSFDRNELSRILSSLEEKAFIFNNPAAASSEYLFRHVLTSDAVYSTLLRRDRDELHGLVGEAIERLYVGQLEGQIEVLAGHFLRSPKLDRALHYLNLAGQKASRDYANEQARRHFEQALELLSKVDHSPDQRIQVRQGLGDVLVFVGEYLPAREQYLAALEALRLVDPKPYIKDRSTLERKIATTYIRQGEFELALSHLDKGEKVLGIDPRRISIEKAHILNEIGWIHFLRGNFDQAQTYLTDALNLVEGTRQYDAIASIHNRLGAVAYHQREYNHAADHVRRSLVLRETIGDMAGVARLYNNLGLLGLMSGDLRDAEVNFYQGIELLEKIGDAEGIALSYTNLGLVQFDRGNFEEAEKKLNTSLATAEHIGHRFYQARALMYLGRLKTAQGYIDQSKVMLLESFKILEELKAQDNLIDAAYYLGENCLARGDLDCALDWVKKSFEIMNVGDGDKNTLSVQRGRVLRLQGVIARVKGELVQAEGLLLESAAIFRSSYERLEAAKTDLELGYLARLRDNLLEARQYFREARLIFKQQGAELHIQLTEEALNQIA